MLLSVLFISMRSAAAGDVLMVEVFEYKIARGRAISRLDQNGATDEPAIPEIKQARAKAEINRADNFNAIASGFLGVNLKVLDANPEHRVEHQSNLSGIVRVAANIDIPNAGDSIGAAASGVELKPNAIEVLNPNTVNDAIL